MEDYQTRHRDFHQRNTVDRPLVGLYRHSIYPMADFITLFSAVEIKPTDLDTQSWLQIYETFWQNTGLMWGDLIHWVSPYNGFPWMEVVAGCPVYLSKESSSVWADKPTNFQIGDEVRLDTHNPWFEKLLQVTEAVVGLSEGRFPVAPGIMRGISDLMVALLGHNNFYLYLKDTPEVLTDMAFMLADFWIEVVSAQYETIPKFDNGYVNAGLWMPGICPVYQEDAAALISGEDFEKIIGPATRRVLQAFPYPIMHFHSTGVHLVPALLNANRNITIEVNIDPTGLSTEELIPIFANIQQFAPLEIFGNANDIWTCLEALPAAGIAYLILESSLEELDGR